MTGARRVPRTLHPIAWWAWALGLATAASRTTNPLLLLLIFAVLAIVVSSRRSNAPWAGAMPYYLGLALIVVVLRVVFRICFGGVVSPDDEILLRLPTLPLPSWLAGIHVGGPVSAQATLAAAFDGLRLGALLCCIGAANALANPKRALRVLPGALYELGVAVVVAMTVAPQLIDSVQRVRRARRLRAGPSRGLAAVRRIAVPVLEDALDRSIRLAAAMDSRGYGRTGSATRASRRVVAGLLLAGMLGLSAGVYSLLDTTTPKTLGTPTLLAGVALCAGGLWLGGRRVVHTRYRPDPWAGPEWVVAGCGVVAAAALFVTTGYAAADLNPSLYPLGWPPLPVVPTVAILLGATAAWVAPPPPRAASQPSHVETIAVQRVGVAA